MRRRRKLLICLSGLAALATACKRPTAATPIPPEAAPATEKAGAEAEVAAPHHPPRLFRGGKVMTAAGKIYERGEVLIEAGRISAVGEKVEVPEGTEIIDITGKVLTPGIVDTHSHMGVYPAPSLRAHSDGNEVVGPITAYARARDGFWPQDTELDYARAGGVTSTQILPGSANLIGGRSFTIKLHGGARSAEDLRFPNAPEGLKMACGENPKRVYGDRGGPNTRMGNIAGFRKAFQDAVEYRQSWQRFEKRRAAWEAKKADQCAKNKASTAPASKGKKDKECEPPKAPKRDFGLETLVKAMDGEILIHNHCYRADEMSIMLELARNFGFHIRSFHHAVEGYKIADRLAREGTSASVWADWWGFKAEAYDGVRENAAMISAAGAKAIIHSDSGIEIQRLNQEAAKAMFAGRRAGIEISEDEALKWITLNAAWALGIHEQTGSIESGKMADLVVWDTTPFSVYAKAQQVYIDGALVYDRQRPQQQPRTDFDVGLRDRERSGQ